jgi:hypothetical protein
MPMVAKPLEIMQVWGGVRYTGYQIGGPRAKGQQTDARALGEPPVDIRHKGCSLFMAGGYETDACFERRIHQFRIFLAGQTEDILDTFIFRTFQKQSRRLPRSFPLRPVPHR